MTEGIAISNAGESAESAPLRRRVRTPGKHIVFFFLAVTFMLALSSSLIHGDDLDGRTQRGGGSDALRAAPMEFLVDLAADAEGRISYLKLSATAVAADAKSSAAIASMELQIRERVTFLLRALSPEDFEGDDGMERVKAEMLRRINLVIAPNTASDLVIDDLVIQ